MDTVANVRRHGTIWEWPLDRLAEQRAYLTPFPGWEKVAPFVWEEGKVGRHGYVQWEQAYYGVHWVWSGKKVQVRASQNLIELWVENEARLSWST